MATIQTVTHNNALAWPKTINGKAALCIGPQQYADTTIYFDSWGDLHKWLIEAEVAAQEAQRKEKVAEITEGMEADAEEDPTMVYVTAYVESVIKVLGGGGVENGGNG